MTAARPLPARAWRALRVSLHLVRGLATTTFVFPRAGRARRRALTRAWSRRLVALMGLEMRVDGMLAHAGQEDGNVVYVANHVSWLDIFVINALAPAQFIAKAELAHWPLVGRLIRDTETIFVERARRADTRRVNAVASAALAGGARLALFPEGTTSEGIDVLRFHASLLQPPIDSAGLVQPVALRYVDGSGRTSPAVEYVGATTFVQSFWRICGTHGIVVEVTAFPPAPAAGATRRELATRAETLIRSAVAQAAGTTAPGTPSDRRA
ncbi:MAG: 1-acyl-sn-glycerol-3-phosphate acyltransferase [Proteobacteria bacterium]|nr:1-acyl-sn-glycerol-3-phosphate acyltransferase [Pseudomonadota bacterium]